jgi:hypothetical protein
MELSNIAREIASLPPDAQKQMVDFLAFLKTRYQSASVAKRPKRLKLSNEPFIGMWRKRKDMTDSTAWVRALRQQEWKQGLQLLPYPPPKPLEE